MILHGLVKVYYIQQNALQNMTLMQFTLNKIFRQDDYPFEAEVLQPLNKLFDNKKKKV